MIPISFQPRYSQQDIHQHLINYRANPSFYTDEQAKTLENYAQYYKLPFSKDEFDNTFSVLGAIRQAAEGYVTGFTTFEIGKESRNPIEKIFRSVGQLAGFVGYLPGLGPKTLAKLGISASSKLYKALSGAKALAGKELTSVPMYVANKIQDKLAPQALNFLAKSSASKSAAMKVVGNFLAKDIPRDMIAGAFHMGTASAVSSWQHGIDDMFKSFVGGATTGAAFRGLGNIAGPGAIFDIANKNAVKSINILSHSLYSGLPATLRNQTAPEQVYEYLLGAYFGARSGTSTQNIASKFVQEHNRKFQTTHKYVEPETMDSFNLMSVGAQTEARNMLLKQHQPAMAEAVIKYISDITGRSPKKIREEYGDIVKTEIVTPAMLEPFGFKGEAKSLAKRINENYNIAFPEMMARYSVVMDKLAISSETNDVNEYENIVPIEVKVEDFISKYALDDNQWNPVDDSHKKIYEKTKKKWDKIQPYGQKKNNADKMVDWLIKQPEYVKATDGTKEELKAFWLQRAGERINNFEVELRGYDKFGRLYPVTNGRTATNEYRFIAKPKEILEKIYLDAYTQAYGQKPDENSIVYVDHFITKQLSAKDADPKDSSNWRLKMGSPARNAPDNRAMTSMSIQFDKEGRYYFSGSSDKPILKFIKYHPGTDELVKNKELNKAFKRVSKEIAEAIGNNPQEVELTKNRMAEAEARYIEQFTGNKNKAKEIYRKSFVSNVLYDFARNGITDIATKDFFDITFNKSNDFVNTVKAFNKREQIWASDAIPIDTGVFKERTGRTRLRYAIMDDVKVNGKTVDSPSLDYTEGTDGAWYVLPEYMEAFSYSLGLPTEGNMGKPMIADPGKDGALLGKTLFSLPPKALEEYMRANGLDMMAYSSSAKQKGTRATGTFDHVNKQFVPNNGKQLSIKNGIYSLPVESIRMVPTKVIDAHYMDNITIASQIYSNMLPESFVKMNSEVIKDFYNSTVGESVSGDPKENERLFKYMYSGGSEKDLQHILKNVDKIGVNQLFEAIHDKTNKDFSIKLLQAIYRKNAREIGEDIADYTLTEMEASHIINQGWKYKTVTDKIIEGTEAALFPFLDPYVSEGYGASVINGYIRRRLTKPKIGNSMTTLMRAYTQWDADNEATKALNTDDSIFYLGKKMRNKVMTDSALPDGKMTLGEIWDNRNNTKYSASERGAMRKIIDKVAVTRAPIETASGIQQLRFAGFSDYDDFSIMLHGRTMQALAGADLDGDTAMVYFGGSGGFKQEWVEMFGAQKKEYYHDKDGKTYTAPEVGDDPFIAEKTIVDGLTSQIMNDPALKYDPSARALASRQAYVGRAGLGAVVNMRQFILSAYNEMIETNRDYSYKFKDRETEKEYEVVQTVKKGKPTDKMSVLERIHKSTSASAKIYVDPMDYDGFMSPDEMSRIDILNAFDFKVKDSNGKEISIEDVPTSVLKGGATSLFATFKQSMTGRHFEENRPYTPYEKHQIARELADTFPMARSALTMQANTMTTLDYGDSLFKRLTTQQVEGMYDSYFQMNIMDEFHKISKYAGLVGKGKKKEIPVKKHELIDTYMRLRLFDYTQKLDFLENEKNLPKKLMLSKWYNGQYDKTKRLVKKGLRHTIKGLPRYDEYVKMNAKQRSSALRAIDLVAEEFLANDIRDITSAMATTAVSDKMTDASVKKAWDAAMKIKQINRKDYRENGKKLGRDEVILKSDQMAIELKKTLSKEESILFDTLMLSTFRGEGFTLSTKQGLEMNSTNLGVVKMFYGIHEKIYDELIDAEWTPEKKQMAVDYVKANKNRVELYTDTPEVFKTETQKEMLKGVKLGKGDPIELDVRAKRTANTIISFMQKNKHVGNIEDLNRFSLFFNGKTLNNSTMVDLEDMSRKIKDIERGGGRLLSFQMAENIKKHPELKSVYYTFFPKWVAEDMMANGTFGIDFTEEIAPYMDKKGEIHMTGVGLTPTHTIIESQNFADYKARMATQLEQKMSAAFISETKPLLSSEDGPELWKAMIATRIENGMIGVLGEKNPHAIGYIKNFKKYSKYLKELGNKPQMIDGESKPVTPSELMDRMHKAHKKVMNTIYTWHAGQPDFLKKYEVKEYLYKNGKRVSVLDEWNRRAVKQEDANAWYRDMIKSGWKPVGNTARHYGDMPIYDYKAFIHNEIRGKKLVESPVDLNIGMHNFRLIEHSMQLSTNMHRDHEFVKNLINTRPSPPRSLGDFYHNHSGWTKRAVKAELDNVVKKIMGRKGITPERMIEEFHNLSQYTRNELLQSVQENSSDELWHVLGPEITEQHMTKAEKNATQKWWETFLISKHERRRQAHTPEWDLSPDSVIAYISNEAKALMNHAAQIGIRDEINKSYYRGKGKIDDATLVRFTNFYRLQAQSVLGFAQVIPDDLMNDPGMKLNKSLMRHFADNVVVRRLNKIGEKLGLIAPEISISTDLSAIEARLKSWRFDEGKLRGLANIEAKYQLAALLSHPKVSFNNIYGGSTNTAISAGLGNFRTAQSLKALQRINPKWDSWEKIDRFVIESGVIEEFMIHQAGLSVMPKTKNFKAFMEEATKMITKNPNLEDKNLMELARKHKLTDAAIDAAGWFMKVSERKLRKDAFLSHLVQTYKNWDGVLQHDHPFVIKQALNGVKATQFLYSAAFRPMFANTALGKVATRFQLWAWNSVRFRNDIIREAGIRGFRQGTQEFDRFKRMALADIMAVGLANVFMYSIFESALPAPYSWLQDFADTIFGDEKERERAFFGAYPGVLKPLQLVTPSALRLVGPTLSAFVNDDFSKMSSYHIWSAFPFGRMLKDVIGPNNILQNPSLIMEKTTGLPYRGLINYSTELKKKGAD